MKTTITSSPGVVNKH